MANTFRYKRGMQDLNRYPVASATVIERGDMVWQLAGTDVTTVYNAAAFTWTSNLATTQANFAAVFLGVALESSADGQTDPILVDSSPFSVYEYPCPSATYAMHTPVGPDENSSALHDQQLEKAVAASSIARVVRGGAGVTTIEVQFSSAFGTSASNVNSNIG